MSREATVTAAFTATIPENNPPNQKFQRHSRPNAIRGRHLQSKPVANSAVYNRRQLPVSSLNLKPLHSNRRQKPLIISAGPILPTPLSSNVHMNRPRRRQVRILNNKPVSNVLLMLKCHWSRMTTSIKAKIWKSRTMKRIE